MTIQVGDTLPQSTFRVMTADGPQPTTTDDIFRGRKVVLIAVPGAFTPTCDRNHLPGYVSNAEAIKAKGIDAIAVTAVNDVFVMNAWAKSSGGADKVEFLADGNGDFAKAIGLTMDGSGFGLGTRSKRYSMIVEDGVVRALNVEDAPGKAEVSGAEAMMKALSESKAQTAA
jgi:glutaredoxin/glutathione-dependent peroxiredoxin